MVCLILLCWLFAVIATGKPDDDFCNASDPCCRKIQLLSDKLNTANQENRRLQTLLDELVCKDTNCQNGGTCYASNDAHATCLCPQDFSGERCENQITCSQDCGPNAECVVVDHAPVCRCHYGFTKGADNTCIQKTYTAYIQGDPHYTTFDGLSYTYHGRCWTHLLRRCNDSNDLSFQVRGLNAVYREGERWSNLKTLQVIIRGIQYQFEDQTLYVDGKVKSLPYCCDNVIVNGDSWNILLTDTVTGVTVKFEHLLTTITVPHTDFFVGKNNFCGLLGSIDGDCKDDFQFPNGTLIPTPDSCDSSTDSEQRDMLAVGFSDSYIFDHDSCETGEDIGYRSCNEPANDTACHLIEQAITGQGPFGACKNLPSLHALLSNCRKDTCFGVSNCVTMTTFVSTCLEAFPWVKLSDWRSTAECPYKCGSHSSYSLQTPVCQETCARKAAKKDCDNGFKEGCICDPGYLYDQTSTDNSCIAKEECGCLSKDGNYYPPKTIGLTDTCSKKFKCAGGDDLTLEDHSCGHGKCEVKDYHETCVCDKGYELRDMACVDVEMCLHDTKLCGANIGHGTCTSVGTNYQCTCNEPWDGPECTEFAPRRHCADILKYRKTKDTGVYTVFIGAEYAKDGTILNHGNKVQVFCEMHRDGGGWTLIAGGAIEPKKTFDEYKEGFGNPNLKAVWLGLDNIHTLTTTINTVLLVLTQQCPEGGSKGKFTFMQYPSFSVLDASQQYAVVLPVDPDEKLTGDGWTDWDTPNGPKFQAFDNSDPDMKQCIDFYEQAGWWYGNACKHVNLNGKRPDCDKVDVFQHAGYVTWDNINIKDAYMYVRPAKFPDYDT